jgi:hypothetical protein
MANILDSILGAVSNSSGTGSTGTSPAPAPIGGSKNSFMPFSTGGALVGGPNTAQGVYNQSSVISPTPDLSNSMFPSLGSSNPVTPTMTPAAGSAPTPFSNFATPAAVGGTPQVIPPGTGPTLPASVTTAAAGPSSILQQIIQATNPGANVVDNPNLTYATGS